MGDHVRRLPPGVCDTFGDVKWFLAQAQIECGACRVGWHRPRWCWRFFQCPTCHGDEDKIFCEDCQRAGVIAVPLEQYPNGQWVRFIDAGHGVVEVWDLSVHGSLADYDRLFVAVDQLS